MKLLIFKKLLVSADSTATMKLQKTERSVLRSTRTTQKVLRWLHFFLVYTLELSNHFHITITIWFWELYYIPSSQLKSEISFPMLCFHWLDGKTVWHLWCSHSSARSWAALTSIRFFLARMFQRESQSRTVLQKIYVWKNAWKHCHEGYWWGKKAALSAVFCCAAVQHYEKSKCLDAQFHIVRLIFEKWCTGKYVNSGHKAEAKIGSNHISLPWSISENVLFKEISTHEADRASLQNLNSTLLENLEKDFLGTRSWSTMGYCKRSVQSCFCIPRYFVIHER